MRLLAIDVGNTRLKWGTHDGTRWLQQSSMATERVERLEATFAGLPLSDVVIISNVAGIPLRKRLTPLLPLKPKARWIKSERAQCGVKNGYDRPPQLGCDRWAALIGAYRLCNGPLVVVNAGTALTVDALSKEGIFIGGIIVPGVRLMQRSLASNTAALGSRSGRFNQFPTATSDAIMSGAIDALTGAITRVATFLERRTRQKPLCILSGGDAGLLAPQLTLKAKVVDNLVLEGLLVIAHKKTK